MEDLLISVLKSAYDKTGWFGLLLTGGAFSIVMIIYNLSKESLKPFFSKIFKPKNVVPPLKDHLIFKKYDFIRDTKLPQIKLKCPLRRHIFTKLISIRLQSHKKSALDFVNNGEYSELTSEQLKLVVREFVYGSKNAWVLAAHQANIPEIVLRKYTERTAELKNIMHDAIDTICSSVSLYPTNLHKLNCIFDLLMTLEEHLYVFLEQVLDKLNGELSKAEYEGMKCTDCDTECMHVHKTHPQLEVAKQNSNVYLVLYVEDDVNSLAFLPKKLIENDLHVVIARSNHEVRTMLCQRKFDAVILGDNLDGGKMVDLIPSLKIINMPFIFATADGTPPMEGYVAHSKFNNTKAIYDSICKQIENSILVKKNNDSIPLVLFLCRDRLIGDVLQLNAVKHGIEIRASTITEEIISLIQEYSGNRKTLVVVDDMIGESQLNRVAGSAMNFGIPMTLYGQSNEIMKPGENIISRNLSVDSMLNLMVSFLNGKYK